MGKGGEQSVSNNVGNQSSKKLKLEHMPTEELRKWAKAYNVNSDKDRQYMLQELVSTGVFNLILLII